MNIKNIIRYNVYNFLNELKNPKTNNNIWYHGSKYPYLTIENIQIDYKSPNMFFGGAFYVASDMNLAKKYGNYIYEVKFEGNFYYVRNREFLGTYGTFQQYLDIIYESYKDNILDYIKEDPTFWLKKLKITKSELMHLYKYEDSASLSKYFIEKNKKNLFEEYLENQMGIVDEYTEEGYDGLLDDTQAAIFTPQKSISEISLIQK